MPWRSDPRGPLADAVGHAGICGGPRTVDSGPPVSLAAQGIPGLWATWATAAHRRDRSAGTVPHTLISIALRSDRYDRERLLAELPELVGKKLACWCAPGQECHADAIAEMVAALPERDPPAQETQSDAAG